MSETAENQLPSLEDASALIDQQIVKRAFFQRMRERGHVPQTEKQAQAMWNVAIQLSQLPPDNVKQADANDLYSAGEVALQSALAGSPDQNHEAQIIKQAAWELAHNPQFYNAALVIKAAEAEELVRAAAEQQTVG